MVIKSIMLVENEAKAATYFALLEFCPMIAPRPLYFGEGEIGSIPRSRATAPAMTVQGFMACPPSLMMGRFGELGFFGMGTQELYRLAYEQAKACVAPPWHLQSLLAGTN